MMTKTQYLLDCLAEECCEVGQRASKAIRFGIQETEPGQELTNRQRLSAELRDLLVIVDLLGREHIDFDALFNETAREEKKKRVLRTMEYSRQLGQLEEDD